MISLSADVGGTFTDVVLADSASGRTYADKVLTTPGTSDAIVSGILRLSARAGVKPSDIDIFVHGFTIATNAWLTRSGARVVLAVTRGFRDVLEIATQRRSLPYSLTQTRTTPLAPRSRVVEVDERMDAFGAAVVPLCEQEAARAADAILALKPEAVAISLLFSYLDPAHEDMLAEALHKRAPSTWTTSASEPPTAFITLTRLDRHWRVCSRISPCARTSPDPGSRGIWTV